MNNLNKLKKYFKFIKKKVLDEEGNISSAVGSYNTPFAFKKTKGYRPAPKNPLKKSKMFDKVKYEAINKKKGRRYIPPEYVFPSYLLQPVQITHEQSAKLFKLVKNDKDQYILLMAPLVKAAMEDIRRGRTSFANEQKLSAVVRFLKEKVPQDIRGLLKKGVAFGKITDMPGGYIPINVIINKVDENGDVYCATGSAGSEPTIQPPKFEALDNMIKEELLNEVSYHSFRNELKQRSKSEQFQKAVYEIKKKLYEVNKLVGYTTEIRSELNETDGGFKHDRHTEKACKAIYEIVSQLSERMKGIMGEAEEEVGEELLLDDQPDSLKEYIIKASAKYKSSPNPKLKEDLRKAINLYKKQSDVSN